MTTRDVPRASGWCAWHRDVSEDVRAITAIEAASGPGAVLQACPTCIAEHQLVPLAEQDPDICAGLNPVASGAAMLALPKTTTLSDAQLAGDACPWCGSALEDDARVDLGERPGPRGAIRPAGCRSCVNRLAREHYTTHHRRCARCQQHAYCAVPRVWRRLALDTRR